jgi:hypothetical protein
MTISNYYSIPASVATHFEMTTISRLHHSSRPETRCEPGMKPEVLAPRHCRLTYDPYNLACAWDHEDRSSCCLMRHPDQDRDCNETHYGGKA